MPEYICVRCNYKTEYKGSMYSHILKNVKCPININSMEYSDDETVKLSLSNYPKNSNNKVIYKNYKVTKTRTEFINELKNIYKDKLRKCNFCNSTFDKFKELEDHLFSCVYINDNSNIIQPHEDKNIINNIINNNQIFNNCNFNINIEIPEKTLLSFDERWSTEHLDTNTKTLLFLSTYRYTKTLEFLLKNDINKNVLLDSDSGTGLIYKGGNENKFEKMDLKDIIDKSMLKLNKHLQEFHTELTTNNDTNYNIDNDIINQFFKFTKYELLNYASNNGNNNTHKELSEIITSIYDKNKDETKNKYIELIKMNENKKICL